MEAVPSAGSSTATALAEQAYQQFHQRAAALNSLPQAQALVADLLAQHQAIQLENQQLQVAQQELAMSEARLKATEAVAGIGSYELDLGSGTLHFSAGLYRLLGETPDSVAPSLEWLDARTDPADVAVVRQVLERAQQERQPYHYTRRICRADGQWRTLESYGRVVVGDAGQARRLEGVVQDITARQRAEQELLQLKSEVAQQAEDKYRTLFNSMAEGFALIQLVRDEHGRAADARYLELNPAFEQQTGLDRTQALGQLASALFPAFYLDWLAVVERALRTGQPERFEQYVPDNDRWYVFHVTPVGGADLFGVFYDDLTARRQHEQRQQLLLQLSDALRPLADAREIQRAATRVVGEYFGLDRAMYAEIMPDGETVVVTDNYLSGRFPAFTGAFPLAAYGSIISKARRGEPLIIEDIDAETDLTDAERMNYQAIGSVAYVTIPLIKGGRWAANFVVHQGKPRRWTPMEVAVLQEVAERTWDAVERAKAEDALRESEERFRNLVESYAQAVWETDPAGQVVQDSPSWRAHTGQTEAEWLSYGWVNAIHPDDQAYAGRQWREAVAAGRDVNTEFQLKYAPEGYRWTNVRATPIRDAQGRIHKWAGMNIDIHDRKTAEDALQRAEERLLLALDAAELGTWDWNLATDEVHWNARHFTMLGLMPHPDPVTSELFARYVHPDDWPGVLARLQAAIADNHLFEAEFRVNTAQGELRWLSGHGQPTTVSPEGRVQRLSGVVLDVTARKHTEQHLQALAAALERKVQRRTQALQESRDLLQSVYDTTLIGMAMLHAVRDEASGAIEDFTFRSANKELARLTGRAGLTDRHLVQEFPGMRPSGVLALMAEAVETGQPQQAELFYPYDGLHRWLAVMFIKLDGGVVATILDITERKTAEQQLFRNLHLLEQAETVAQLGSWDYDLATAQFYWSNGMYQLFELPLGQSVTPPVYLGYVVAEDRPRAEQLVQQITTGAGDLEVTLRLRVNGAVKTVRIKSVVLRNAQGQAVRVLGVDLDLSELHRLEADNLRLQLSQQQALFEAVQAAEEQERRRMSESLHNGIGQLLYATKLQLDRLPDTPASPPRQQAAHLLGEAIRQTRTLSHELTPAILEDHGLEKTLQSMCSTLNGAGLHWRCHLAIDEGPALPMPLQLAVYRLAQELAQNVLKHAHATHATLEVDVLPAWVVLRIEDNGRGFDPAHTSDGLGLRSLRSRAALLGGSVHLTTAPDQGTQCQIRIPLPPPTP